jgi:hypothetical protein
MLIHLATLALASPTLLGSAPPEPVVELYQLAPGEWQGLISAEAVFETNDKEYFFLSGLVTHHPPVGGPVHFEIAAEEFWDNLWSWNIHTGRETTPASRTFQGIVENNRVVFALPTRAAEISFGPWVNPDHSPDKIEIRLYLISDEDELEELYFVVEPTLEGNELLYSYPVGPAEEAVEPDLDLWWAVGAHRTNTVWGGKPHPHRLSWVHDFWLDPTDAVEPYYSTQRFAIDTSLYDASREDTPLRPDCDDPLDNACYLTWNAPISVIGPGTIVDVWHDDKDNPVVGETIGVLGNYVFQELDSGLCVAYFHLKQGSAQVTVGDYVVPGDVIGRVGNSGNSSGPHLHFDVTLPHKDLLGYTLPCFSGPAEAQTMYFGNIDIEHALGGSTSGYQGALSGWDRVFPVWPGP